MADRILVIRLGALGDVVRTFPAVSALRSAFPRASITWLVEPASAAAVEGQPWVDEVLVFPREALRSSLRAIRLATLTRDALAFVVKRSRTQVGLDDDGRVVVEEAEPDDLPGVAVSWKGVRHD